LLASTLPPALLVVNIGWFGPERFSEPATAGLVAALQSGVPTLLVHSTLTAFPEWPLWQEIAGGGWTYGTTYHPAYGPAVALAKPEHPLTAGLDRVAIVDERYTKLWVDDQAGVFLEHEEGGRRHPLAWTRAWGRSPIVADALGHDSDSYRAGAARPCFSSSSTGCRARCEEHTSDLVAAVEYQSSAGPAVG